MKRRILLSSLVGVTALTLSATAGAMPVLADDAQENIFEEMSAVPLSSETFTNNNSAFRTQSEESASAIIEEAKDLPEKIDLRDYNGMNYVTPVKYQAPFTSCWAFAIAAASEISYLYETGQGVPAGEVNNNADFSEKHISWFMYNRITDADVNGIDITSDQVGEGYNTDAITQKDKNAVHGFGGNMGYGSNFLASGMGPVRESLEVNGTTPFTYSGVNGWRENNKGESQEQATARKDYYFDYYKKNTTTLQQDGEIEYKYELYDWYNSNWHEGNKYYDQTFKTSYYSIYDDWTLPLSLEYRIPGVSAFFKQSNVLPEPAGYNDDFSYKFNEEGVAAIKLEVSKGRGVSIGFMADESSPDDTAGDDGFMNRKNWAQYYGGKIPVANHAVTVVGYDDNYPKENFTRTVNGEVRANSTPPGDGAFIVKNSWGALTDEDRANVTYDEDGDPIYENPNARDWGIDGTGYFYLSYYDHSIVSAESFEFFNEDEVEYKELDYAQHDLFQGIAYDERTYENEARTANVFDIKRDGYLYQISYMTTAPGTDVTYEIYRDVKDGDPTSGTLLETGTESHMIGGYHRLTLKDKYFFKKGEKYSVVITQTHKNDDGANIYSEVFGVIMNPYSSRGATVKTVINPGESYRYSNGKWTDQTEFAKEYVKDMYENARANDDEETFDSTYVNGIDDFGIDNYPIKAFIIPAEEKEDETTTEATESDESTNESSKGSEDPTSENKTDSKGKSITKGTDTGDRFNMIPIVVAIIAATGITITLIISFYYRKKKSGQ